MKVRNLLLLAALFAGTGFSAQADEFDPEGIKISGDFQNIYGFEIAPNELGGVTTAFRTPQQDIYSAHPTYLVKYDSEGNDAWGEMVMVSSEPTITYTKVNDILMMDRDNNAIVAVLSGANAAVDGKTPGNENYNIFKVSPDGEQLWGGEGVDLMRGGYSSDNVLYNVKMIQLEDGSYITAYGSMTSDGGMIYLDRISSDGEFLWDGPLEVKDDNYDLNYPYLVEAGDNQFILFFVKGGNQDIMARKMDFDGESVWGTDLRIYRGGGFSAIPFWTFFEVISDGEGGAFVGWYDDRYSTNYEKSYCSHITTDGKLGFSSGIEGERLTYTDGVRGFSPKLYYDKNENALYAAWRQTTWSQAFQYIRLQKLSMSGELLWETEGIPVVDVEGQVAYISVRDAGDDNIAVFYMANPNYVSVTGYVQLYNKESGEAVLADPTAITCNNSTKSYLEVTPLINGQYWYAVWQDQRRLPGEEDLASSAIHLYMQRVEVDGSLRSTSKVVTLKNETSMKVFADDNALVMRLSGEYSDLLLEVWSADGKQLMKQGYASLSAGDYRVSMPSLCGAYIVKLSGHDSTGKLVNASSKLLK